VQIAGVPHAAGGAMSVQATCRRHGITATTFFRWRAEYGGMHKAESRA